MKRLLSTWILSTLLIPMLLGCQPSKEPANSSTSPVAPAATDSATMKLVVVTHLYDSNGESQDQQIEMVDATPEVVTERFKAIDWSHATNRYQFGLTSGAINSSEYKKLSINEVLPEGSQQTVLAANLEETLPDATSEKSYTIQPLESPDVGLNLLLSFLAQNGEYRTMVNWQEK